MIYLSTLYQFCAKIFKLIDKYYHSKRKSNRAVISYLEAYTSQAIQTDYC